MLADFGSGQAGQDVSGTVPGMKDNTVSIATTPGYVAPDLYAQTATGKADTYSLGVVINRMTGVWVQPRAPVPSVAVLADFELRGCDPEKPYPVIFFQEKNGWGALVQVPGKQAGKPLEVRLQPCGAARARFLTADGRPVTGRKGLDLLMVLNPGDTAPWSQFIWHSNIRKDWTTDAQGRITWRDLVPGVTYRVGKRDFTVKPGEVLDLGDLR